MSLRHRTQIALLLLLGLFALRVFIQFVLYLVEVPFLPEFSAWSSGTLTYQVLLSIQVLLIVFMVATIANLDALRVSPRIGSIMIVAAMIYIAVMTGRSVIGVAGLVDHPFFNSPLPTMFHFVLAGFLWVLGDYWRRSSDGGVSMNRPWQAFAWLAFPVLVIGAMVFHRWLLCSGVSPLVSTYLPVLFGFVGVAVHELLLPYRERWIPQRQDIINDGLYMILVQVILPALLSLALATIVLVFAGWSVFPKLGFWPHQAPVAVQAILMLVVADFFRYWLHRGMHQFSALWRLHAVHHSPDVLYALNVGRFHPLEKSIQFFADALPFVVIGVSQEVISVYFIFYAINGFYQHSNAYVRLGFFNYIIAGPELHRWHHAKDVATSNHNFGNNLIIWDWMFGTRHLPRGGHVGELGIGNPTYPRDFIKQTLAPFTLNPNDGG